MLTNPTFWLAAGCFLLGWCVFVLTARRKLAAPAGALAVGMIVLVDLFSVDKRYVSAESFAAIKAGTKKDR